MDVIPDKYLEKINKLKVNASKTNEIQQIEIMIARELSESFQGEFYCANCENKFDVGMR